MLIDNGNSCSGGVDLVVVVFTESGLHYRARATCCLTAVPVEWMELGGPRTGNGKSLVSIMLR